MTHFETYSNTRPKKALVTGGAGFIGSHFVEHYLSKFPNCSITVLDKFTYASSSESVSLLNRHDQVEFLPGDIKDRAIVERAVQDQDFIFHFAAETHVPKSFSSPDVFFETNVEGTRCLIDEAVKQAHCRFVHISTDEVYGPTQTPVSEGAAFNPTSPYARSKVEAENVVKKGIEAGLDAVIIRPTNAIGIRQNEEKLTPRFIKLVLENRPLTIDGNGSQKRCLVPVHDLVSAITLISQYAGSGDVFNVPGKETFSVIELAKLVSAELNRECKLEHVADRLINDENYQICGKKLAGLGYVENSSAAEEIRNVAMNLLLNMRPIESGARLEPLPIAAAQ